MNESMEHHETSRISTNTLFFILLTLLGLTFYLFSQLLVPVLFALIFVVVTMPLFKKFLVLCRGHRVIASVLFCFLSFFVFVFIVAIIASLILGEVLNLKDVAFNSISTKIENWFNPDDWNEYITESNEKIRKIAGKLPFINEETISTLTQSILQETSVIFKNISTGIIETIKSGFKALGGFFLGLIYFYLAALLFFIDGEKALNRLLYLLPIRNRHILEIEARFRSLFHSWILGNIAIMIVQGILGGIGFWLAGIPSPTIWGVIITFTSLVPFIGTALIIVPTAIFLLFSGHYIAGIFLAIWGFAIVGTSDNFIRPLVLKSGAHLPILVLLFALIGGIQTFGFKGLLLGPIIVVFLDTILHIYSLEYESVLKKLNK